MPQPGSAFAIRREASFEDTRAWWGVGGFGGGRPGCRQSVHVHADTHAERIGGR